MGGRAGRGGNGASRKKKKKCTSGSTSADSSAPLLGRKTQAKWPTGQGSPATVSWARAGSRATTAVVTESAEESAEQELARFRLALAARRLGIRDVARDGNCFFSALADQIFGSPTQHVAAIRASVCDAMVERADEFAPFIAEGVDHAPDDTEAPSSPATTTASVATSASSTDDDRTDSFSIYIDRLRRDGAWAGHIEAQAASDLFQINIRIHQLDRPVMEIINFSSKTHPAIDISYHQQEHYASIRPLDRIDDRMPLVTINPKILEGVLALIEDPNPAAPTKLSSTPESPTASGSNIDVPKADETKPSPANTTQTDEALGPDCPAMRALAI